MIILACETSTLLGSVAVLEDGKILSLEQSMRQGSHSEVLNVFIEKALATAHKKLNDVDLFATGIGPGSFTGLRICLNTIKTLAYCQQKPVVGFTSLQTLATQAQMQIAGGEFATKPIISMINAYKNMLYVAQFESLNGELTEVKKPQVIRVQELSSFLPESAVVCGDGYAAYEKYFPENLKQKMLRLTSIPDEPSADTLAQIAFQNSEKGKEWNQILPLYLRASEAEENLAGIKLQPLN